MRRNIVIVSLVLVITILVVIFNDHKKVELTFHQPLMSHLTTKEVPERYILVPLEDVKTEAKVAMIVNAVTGDVLFEKNSTNSVPVASMSKIMSELIVLEAIEAGDLAWDDDVSISEYAYEISHQPGYSSVLLEKDRTYTVEQLFKAMVIHSANGATIALAEKVAGSEREFVQLMNEKAIELSLDASSFVNSTGLTNVDLLGNHPLGSEDDMNKMSASDLVRLSIYILNEYPELLEITKLTEFMLHDETFLNSNWMLPESDVEFVEEDVTFHTVDGLKTGYTKAAGYSFTGTATINDVRIVSVVIGMEEIEDRFSETKKFYQLLEAGNG